MNNCNHSPEFTILGKGQFHWITSPMGLLGCPASFQRLMEGVLCNLQNVIVYIDDLLVHSDTHTKDICRSWSKFLITSARIT